MAVFKTLIIELGGLCMLVLRTGADERTRGLYVLMPDNHHDKDQIHCPLFIAGEAHTQSRRPEFRQLELKEASDEIDLRFMTPHEMTPAGLPDFIPNVSRFYVEPRAVDPKCFSEVKRVGLAARLILPLPKSITEIDSDSGQFWVPTSVPGYRSADLHGRCQIRYTVDDDINNLWKEYQVKGVQFRRDLETLKMYFVNARPKDLGGAKYNHTRGDTWEHPQAYHDLLVNSSSKTGPRAIFRSAVQDEMNDDHKKESCRDVSISTWPPVRRGEVRIMFIDPYTCTLGGGCENPQDQSC